MSIKSSEPEAVSLTTLNLSALESLLQNSGLPFEDCSQHLPGFLGIFQNEELVATGGLEVVQPFGLLRSVATNSRYQDLGYAGIITRALIRKARADGLESLYLLTESARYYFVKAGFYDISRHSAPPKILATAQFKSLCPDSACCMKIDLN